MDLLVVYSVAHTSTRTIKNKDGSKTVIDGNHGTYTFNATTERTVSKNALVGVNKIIGNAGGVVAIATGSLDQKIRYANKKINEYRKLGYRWVSIELHMNSTVFERCVACGQPGLMGIPCRECGTPSTKRWRFGHRNMVLGGCPQAIDLSTYISEHISAILPWSVGRPPIISPEETNRDRFVSARKKTNNGKRRPVIIQPAVLVEGGFAPDPRFERFIDRPSNQQLYGETVANAIVRWYNANKEIPQKWWGEIETAKEIKCRTR